MLDLVLVFVVFVFTGLALALADVQNITGGTTGIPLPLAQEVGHPGTVGSTAPETEAGEKVLKPALAAVGPSGAALTLAQTGQNPSKPALSGSSSSCATSGSRSIKQSLEAT